MKKFHHVLLNIKTLRKFDSKKMYAIYDRWPKIARESFETNLSKINFGNIDHVVFAGMGGSGSVADVFAAMLSKTKLQVSVVKGYHLPKTVNSNTLIVTISVSGNTIETLSVLDCARKSKQRIIAFSAGGKMQDYCKRYKIEHRIATQFHSPRTSFTSFLYTMLNVLGNIIPISKKEVYVSLNELEKTQKKIGSSNLTKSNPSLNLARWIRGVPMIYYPWGLQAAAIRFKNSLQENSKIHAMIEDVIEACHNGVVAWEQPSIVQPIMLEGKDDFVKTKERWRILKEYFKQNDIFYKEVVSIEGNILSKLINLIYVLDYASIYHAILSKIDPSPVNSIDFIKKRATTSK